MTDTDALIELLAKYAEPSDTMLAYRDCYVRLQALAPDLAREVIALRAEIARRDQHIQMLKLAMAKLTPTTGDKDKAPMPYGEIPATLMDTGNEGEGS